MWVYYIYKERGSLHLFNTVYFINTIGDTKIIHKYYINQFMFTITMYLYDYRNFLSVY